MPTLAKRISLTLPHEISMFVASRAKTQNVSMSQAVLNMIHEFSEMAEDAHHAETALKNKAETTSFHSHEEAWG